MLAMFILKMSFIAFLVLVCCICKKKIWSLKDLGWLQVEIWCIKPYRSLLPISAFLKLKMVAKISKNDSTTKFWLLTLKGLAQSVACITLDVHS